MTVLQALLTAEEFRQLPDDGRPRELVRGTVVEMPVPAPRHGYYCGNICRIVGNHVVAKGLGRVMSNDSGIVTERGPDTVRGGDVSYYSYTRLPPGPLPEGYLDVTPELVFEVRSPTDRCAKITSKVVEYFDAAVLVVCVLDPTKQRLVVYRADELPQVLEADDTFTVPELLGDFQCRVGLFLE